MADLRGGARPSRPPSCPKFLHFHAVFGKNWPNNRLAPPPLGLAPPPLGNPGSATEYVQHLLEKGAFVNTSQIEGRSVLEYHLTSHLASTEILCLLLFAVGGKIDFHQSDECFRSASVRNYKYLKRLTEYELLLKHICRQAGMPLALGRWPVATRFGLWTIYFWILLT